MEVISVTWVLQVAKLQGVSDSAADQAVTASGSTPHDDGSTSSAQQWLKQQADSLAAPTSMSDAHDTHAGQLAFLPAFMTRLATSQLTTATADAAGPSAAVPGGAAVQAEQYVAASQPQPDERTEAGNTTSSASTAAALVPQTGNPAAAASLEPVSWLEWEQQLQVMCLHVSS